MIKNSWFDILKWIALICLPALQIAIPALFEIWHIPYGEEMGKTINVVAILLGTLLGVSNVNYYQKKAIESDDPFKLGN